MPFGKKLRRPRPRGFVLIVALFFMILLGLIGTALIGMVPTEMFSESKNRLDTQGHYAATKGILHTKQWITYVITPGDAGGTTDNMANPTSLVNLGDNPTTWRNATFSLLNDPLSVPDNTCEFQMCRMDNLQIPPAGQTSDVPSANFIKTSIDALGYNAGEVAPTQTYVVYSRNPITIGDWKVWSVIVPDVTSPGGSQNLGATGTVAGASGSRVYQIVSIAYFQGIPKLRARSTCIEDSFARFARMWDKGIASPGFGQDYGMSILPGQTSFVNGPIHTNSYFRLRVDPTFWTGGNLSAPAFNGIMTYASNPATTQGAASVGLASPEVPANLNFDNVAYVGGNDPGLTDGFGGSDLAKRPFNDSGATQTDTVGNTTRDRYDRLVQGGKANIRPVSPINLPSSTGSIASAAFGASIPTGGLPAGEVVSGQGGNGGSALGYNGAYIPTNSAGEARGGIYIRGDVLQMALGVVDGSGQPVTDVTALASATGAAASGNPVTRIQTKDGVLSSATSTSFTTSTSTTKTKTTTTTRSTTIGTAVVTTVSTTYGRTTNLATSTTTNRSTTYGRSTATSYSTTISTNRTTSTSTSPTSTTTNRSTNLTTATSTSYSYSTTFTTATQSGGQGGGSILVITTNVSTTTNRSYTTSTTVTTTRTTQYSTTLSTSTSTSTSVTTNRTVSTNATNVSTTTNLTVTTTYTTNSTSLSTSVATNVGTTVVTTKSTSTSTTITTTTGTQLTVEEREFRPIDQVIRTDCTTLTIQPSMSWGGAVPASGQTSTAAGLLTKGIASASGWARPPGMGDTGNQYVASETSGPGNTGSPLLMGGITATAVYVNGGGSPITGPYSVPTGYAVLIKQSRTDPGRIDVFTAPKQTSAKTTLNGAVYSEGGITNLNGWNKGRQTIAVSLEATSTAVIGIADSILQVGTTPGQVPVDANNGLGLVAPMVNLIARQHATDTKMYGSNESLYLYAVTLAGRVNSNGGMKANGGTLVTSGNPANQVLLGPTAANNGVFAMPQWASPPQASFVGGLIEAQQQSRSTYGSTGKVGWADNFAYDQQLANQPPPFFPNDGAMIPLSYEEERLSW